MSQMTHARARNLFRWCVDSRSRWEKAAMEDYRFRAGDQWSDADRAKLSAEGRPCITINITKPQIKLLSGYQRLNRYDPKFLPRTANDLDACKLREAVTKFVFDQNDFEMQEARVFMDGTVCGIGVLDTGYKVLPDSIDGEIYIKRDSPFNYYVDPEAKEPDWTDARYIFKAMWSEKDELVDTYPDKQEEIETAFTQYDKDESLEISTASLQPIWYSRDTHRARVLELWYKESSKKTFYQLADGRVLPKEEVDSNALLYVVKGVTVPSVSVRVKVMLGDVELEDKPSPYEHGLLPFVPFICDHDGEADSIPAGIVRDMKDVQRDLNKRHSQQLHIVNTHAGKQWIVPAGDQVAQKDIQENGAKPNGMIRYSGQQPPGKAESPSIDVGLIQLEQQSLEYTRTISGINPAMMGESSASASGRAKEIDQKQAITHIAPLFDNLRASKKTVLKILWGSKNKKGLIQQYYRDERIIRITGEDGKFDFIPVNQTVAVPTPFGVVHQIVNDLSIGEYDIVISDTPVTPTQRQAQFWALVDAASKLGINVPFDMLLDASDLPQKEELKQRFLQAQQQQQQAAAQQATAQGAGPPPEALAQPNRPMTRNQMAAAM